MMTLALIVALCLPPAPTLAVAATSVSPQGRPLTLSADEFAERHGMVLNAVARGELDAGVARLEALKDDPSAAALVELLDKDIARCRALIGLRTKHLEELVEKHKRVTLERQSGKLSATVTAFADGKLTLTDPKSGSQQIAADELLLIPLVRAFSAKTLQGPDASVRGYAFVLAGDAKEIAALKGSPQADELRADAATFYKDILPRGAAAELVTRLAELETPTDAATASKVATAVEQLMAGYKDYGVVTTRRPSLAAQATAAYELLFDEAKMLRGLSAALDKLPEGRVRLTYDFKKVRKVTDFVADHDSLEDVRELMSGAKPPARDLVVEGGMLRVGGSGVWRHILDFTGSISVTCVFAYEKVDSTPEFVLGVHDDRNGNLVMSWSGLRLMARDKATRLISKSPLPPTRPYTAFQQFTSTLIVSDGVARLLDDGKDSARIDCGSLSRGNLCLAISGQHDLLFHKIVVEARIDTDAVRAHWARAQASQLGL